MFELRLVWRSGQSATQDAQRDIQPWLRTRSGAAKKVGIGAELQEWEEMRLCSVACVLTSMRPLVHAEASGRKEDNILWHRSDHLHTLDAMPAGPNRRRCPCRCSRGSLLGGLQLRHRCTCAGRGTYQSSKDHGYKSDCSSLVPNCPMLQTSILHRHIPKIGWSHPGGVNNPSNGSGQWSVHKLPHRPRAVTVLLVAVLAAAASAIRVQHLPLLQCHPLLGAEALPQQRHPGRFVGPEQPHSLLPRG